MEKVNPFLICSLASMAPASVLGLKGLSRHFSVGGSRVGQNHSVDGGERAASLKLAACLAGHKLTPLEPQFPYV